MAIRKSSYVDNHYTTSWYYLAWSDVVRLGFRLPSNTTPLYRALVVQRMAAALGGVFVLSEHGAEWVEPPRLPEAWDLQYRSRRNFLRLRIDSTPWGVGFDTHYSLENEFELWIKDLLHEWIDSAFHEIFPRTNSNVDEEWDDVPF